MPFGETLSGFFYNEYQRFMKGLDNLTLAEREGLFKSSRRQLRDASKPRLVEIPGWDDVVHLGPRLPVTDEQRTEYWKAFQDKRAPNLGLDVVQEIERRRARAEAFARSPLDPYSQAYGEVHTALDNVQDFMGTLSILGHLVLKYGSKIGLRFIPGLGAAVLAADVLTWSMFFAQLAFPAWQYFCNGPRAAMRAGLGTFLTHRAFKGGSGILARAATGGLSIALRRPISADAVNTVIRAALVIPQTTDNLFGYGLSLGPIVGVTIGSSYALEARSRGVPVEVRFTPSAEHFWPHVRPRLRDAATSSLYDGMAAAAVFEQAALLLDSRSGATDQERLLTVAALLGAVGVLAHDWSGTGWQRELPRLAAFKPAPARHAVDRVGWQEFVAPGVKLPPPRWPDTWGGEAFDTPAATSDLVAAVAAGLDGLRKSRTVLPERAFVNMALNEAVEALWLFLTDDPAAFRVSLAPGWLALERMAAAGFIVHPGADEVRVQAMWNEARAKVENSKHALMTQAEWKQLADAHQVDYVVALPGELPETPSSSEYVIRSD